MDNDKQPIEKQSENLKISKKVSFIRDPKILKIYRPDLLKQESDKDKDKSS